MIQDIEVTGAAARILDGFERRVQSALRDRQVAVTMLAAMQDVTVGSLVGITQTDDGRLIVRMDVP